MVEEIRKRIKAASDNTDEAGPYDEYESGQGVGLAIALQIIEEVVRDHPVLADIQEAALLAYPVKEKLNEKGTGKYDKNYHRRVAYTVGRLAERERLMSGALCGHVDMCGVSSWVELPSKVLSDYLRSNFKEGDDVRVIIIKEEK